MSEWKVTKDILPDKGKTVIVDGGIARYMGEGLWLTVTGIEWPGRPISWDVTHWMPLPPIPTKER